MSGMPAAGVWDDAVRSRARPSRPARRARPARGAAPATLSGVRWDRVGRLAMLFVLAALLYLYLSAGGHMLSKWSQARRDAHTVVSLEREHGQLMREHRVLGEQRTIEDEARQLGIIRPGEQPYVASGLPGN
jgi:hypothetical protein